MEGMSTPHPFCYPDFPHDRRHGPAGYKDYREYRPWLEDEFHFRCVYCLNRKVWHPEGAWVVDHFIPQADAPELECHYDNLIFACWICNTTKSAKWAPHPGLVAYGKCVKVQEDGCIEACNDDGQRLIEILQLDEDRVTQMRRNTLRALRNFLEYDREFWREQMGFPEELPDLKKKQPPAGNSRHEGLDASCYERRQRGELPDVYEQ